MCQKCKEDPKLITCEICDTETPQSASESCNDCSKAICQECTTNIDDNQVCQECRDENYYTCEKCNDLVHSDDMRTHDDTVYCESCFDENYHTCDDCNEYHPVDEIRHTSRGHAFCEFCSENYSYCDSCGDYEHIDDTNWCEHCSRTTCNNCEMCDCNDENDKDDEEINLNTHAQALITSGSNAIADYHPDVNWEFIKDKLDNTSAPFFGVELEIECKNRDLSAKTVGKLLKGHVIATHDGSLNNGFEIVFTPHKYQAFRNLNFKHILKEISKTQATSHDSGTCGLHIHIEKTTWFYKQCVYKDKHYNNADLYQEFYNLLSEDIIKLSRRTTDQIANFCAFNTSRGSRYSAVNLQPNNTVEIRIWRGTLNPKRFKANLQFTLAVYDFLQQHSKVILFNTRNLKQIFHDWLSRTTEYQHLVQYCKSKKLFGFSYKRESKNLELPLTIHNNSQPAQYASQLTDSERVAQGIYS